ncbi:dTDP-4-dehydrorhamnose 3,5-epimerase [Sphingomonas sp. F9_3S_D5_B_2]
MAVAGMSGALSISPTEIDGAYIIRRNVRSDQRGRFSRLYEEGELASAGLARHWVQVNHSVTLGGGTVRGMHFQRPPAAEAKLVSCTAGSAFDVAVDVRKGSATFLKWVGVELDDATSFFIPEGCAHGFQSLSIETHLVYLHSQLYAPEHEAGLRFDDPAVGVEWPLQPARLSARDLSFAPIDGGFESVQL